MSHKPSVGAKLKAITRAHFLLLSGHPHSQELERARREMQMSFEFRFVPISLDEMLKLFVTVDNVWSAVRLQGVKLLGEGTVCVNVSGLWLEL